MADTSAIHSQIAPSPRLRMLAGVLLMLLFAVLAFRMSGSESVRETLGQKAARLEGASGLGGAGGAPFIGPAFTVIEAGIVLLAAGGAAAIAAVRKALSPAKLVYALLVVAVLGCAAVSTFEASNRFAAIAGLLDLALALVAGFAMALLGEQLGPAGRRAAIAGILALLALWVSKGYLQKFVEFPDLAEYLREHRDEALRSQGISDPVQEKLFVSRMNSGEVMGFLSFSNVFATGLVGMLALAAAMVTVKIVAWREDRPPGRGAGFEAVQETKQPNPPAPRVKEMTRSAEAPGKGDIPLDTLAFVAIAILLAAGALLLPMTGSKGGTAIGIAGVVAVIAGELLWRPVVRFRRWLIGLGCVALLAGAALLLAYGLRHDSLPSKSLMFRWHYWTASVPMIQQHPAWGVGLNNFGDYYTAFKRPSSPEDVKDPHNFFVRLAAEAGLPATIAVALLLAWLFARAMRLRPAGHGEAEPSRMGPAVGAACAAAALWGIGYLTFIEAPLPYNVALAFIFAIISLSVFAAALLLLNALPRGHDRLPVLGYITAAAAIGGLAMLIYDQINMALVTGPVAMLFWMLLGLRESHASPSPAPAAAAPAPADAPAAARAPARPWALARPVAALLALLLACAGITALALPSTLMASLDPAPCEFEFLRQSPQNPPAARRALEAALARYPRSVDLHLTHIRLLLESFHEPVAAEIRQTLALDRANAVVRRNLGLVDSDLPPSERAAILREALRLDQQLPPEEYKRFSAEEIAQIQQKIRQLEPAATSP